MKHIIMLVICQFLILSVPWFSADAAKPFGSHQASQTDLIITPSASVGPARRDIPCGVVSYREFLEPLLAAAFVRPVHWEKNLEKTCSLERSCC